MSVASDHPAPVKRRRLIVLLHMSKLLDSGLGRKEPAERAHGEASGAAAAKP